MQHWSERGRGSCGRSRRGRREGGSCDRGWWRRIGHLHCGVGGLEEGNPRVEEEWCGGGLGNCGSGLGGHGVREGGRKEGGQEGIGVEVG